MASRSRVGTTRGSGSATRPGKAARRRLSRIGARKIEPDPVPEHVRQTYHNLVQRLCELPWEADQPQYIQLADDAWVLLRQFMEKLEPELGTGGELDCAQDWGSKAKLRAGLRLRRHGPWGLPAVCAARSLPTPRRRSSAKRVLPRFHSFHWKQRSRLRIHESRSRSTEGVWQKPK